VVAIVGGATAGAEAAGILADRGVLSVVFEQNDRPYGKIEDGLPRWHVKLRQKEYSEIDARLGRPEVHFVPQTKIGRDIPFPGLVHDWGFSAVMLAHGAWRDRPFPVEGAEEFVGRGLVYQNPFIYWFNHYTERDYSGPQYEAIDGAAVVGGGLASIDVLKALQIETVRQALAARGIAAEMLELEHKGVPAVLAAHGLSWETLGLQGATLYYRRRVEDMPLADAPPGADAARQKTVETVRGKILDKARQKYGFRVRPLMLPVGLLVEQDRLVGLRFQRTRVERGRAEPIPGETEEVRAPLIVSSIGSIPEPVVGIEQDGQLYRWADERLGRLPGYETVFSVGNVVTGKGNIADSRRHAIEVTGHLVERFLGLSGGHSAGEAPPDPSRQAAADTATEVAEFVRSRPVLGTPQIEAILSRVRERQRAVGYPGSYGDWIARVRPVDLG
jgi:NADPH-dependent glutamate synthase beta subunit-like oxidoreductase